MERDAPNYRPPKVLLLTDVDVTGQDTSAANWSNLLELSPHLCVEGRNEVVSIELLRS